MDLATTNNGSNNLSVLIGNGLGSFSGATNFELGTSPFGIISADFNGDSKMDLVTSNPNSNNLSVLINNIPNVSVMVDGITLTANQNGASYQWIDCTSNTQIDGQTNQSFTATTNGNYAVIVTLNNCSDTSTCYNISALGINDNSSATVATIFPNPFSTQTVLQTNNLLSNATLTLVNCFGQIVKQINNTLNSIKTATDAIQLSDTTVQSIDAVFQILKVLPTPTAIGGVGIPISVINAVQDVKTFLNNNIGKIKQGIGGLSSILGILVKILTQVLDFLNLLDLITQFCSQENNTPQEQISAELTALTQQQSNQLSPVVINVNGFEMGTETEITDQPLKRRRALARNKQGIVMLKGEWSYSSIDQILIDELVFYIQQNNLKAD
jgi:hypothetical protein